MFHLLHIKQIKLCFYSKIYTLLFAFLLNRFSFSRVHIKMKQKNHETWEVLQIFLKVYSKLSINPFSINVKAEKVQLHFVPNYKKFYLKLITFSSITYALYCLAHLLYILFSIGTHFSGEINDKKNLKLILIIITDFYSFILTFTFVSINVVISCSPPVVCCILNPIKGFKQKLSGILLTKPKSDGLLK